jgi:hypothetical protein
MYLGIIIFGILWKKYSNFGYSDVIKKVKIYETHQRRLCKFRDCQAP